MDKSQTLNPGRLKALGYPVVFIVIAIVLGFGTLQIVNRLAVETASAKLRTLVQTSAAAFVVWGKEHQNIVQFLADDLEIRSAIVRAFEQDQPAGPSMDNGSGGSRIDALLNPAMDRFGYSGYAVMNIEREFLLGRGIQEEVKSKVALAMDTGQDRLKPFIIPTATLDRDGAAEKETVGVADEDEGAEEELLREDSLAFFAAPILDATGRQVGFLILQLPASTGLDAVLTYADIGATGETFVVDSQGKRLTGFRTGRFIELDLHELVSTFATSKPEPFEVPKIGEPTMTVGEVQVQLNGIASRQGELVAAGARVDQFDAAIVTLIERKEVFRAVVALQNIMLAILALLLIAAGMNWAYVRRLTALRGRVTEARDRIRTLGQYHLESKIGEGGMGVVYRASHSLLQRPTAVKLILPDRASDRTIKHFEREVMLTARLTHPNTIAIYDYGRTEEGIFYYAMEYLDGINLSSLIDAEGPQPWPRVVHILIQVCESLSEAHAHGLIHRDIKPENVMLCKRGNRHDVVKVLDFGLAQDYSNPKSRALTSVQGTPAYMAPESILKPESIDARVDVYAVGALGYYLLSGRHVFSGDTIPAILGQQLNSRPIPLSQGHADIPEGLQQLLMECLAKEPGSRPAPILALAHSLKILASAPWTEDEARGRWEDSAAYVDIPGRTQSESGTVLHTQSIAKTIDLSDELHDLVADKNE